jgi:hypothetical protein
LNLEASKLAVYDLGKPESIKPTNRPPLLGAMEKRVRLEDEEMSGGGKGHKLEDETRVRTDYLSFLAFLEAGQIKVSRVLIWGRRHDAKQIQTVPVYPGLPPHRGIGVLVLGYWGIGVGVGLGA